MSRWNAQQANDDTILGQQQDAEFCRILRAAIEQGYESCPIGVSTEPGTEKPIVMTRRCLDSYY
jgi:hypothetical protein